MPKQQPTLRTSRNLTLQQKSAVIQFHTANPSLKHSDLANWLKQQFNLPKAPDRTTISKILQDKEKYTVVAPQDQSLKRSRFLSHPELDIAVANWVLQMEHRKIRISGDLIKEKACQFAGSLGIINPPTFSNGWLQSFNQRHSFRENRIHGESRDAQMTNIDELMIVIKGRIAEYDLPDIYNMDETGLFYNLAPDTTISRRQIEGSKKDKTRLTIGFTCNADGSDCLPPLFIGHAAKPRCFNKKSGAELGFFYLHNKKAWMTGVFFQEFIKIFNNHVNKRRVLLLLDNAPSHIWTDTQKAAYPNIELLFLPPNTTSKLQPMDAGIISAFKRQLQHAVDMIEDSKPPYKIDQLTAMYWSAGCWRTMDSSVLANCWRHSTILTPIDTMPVDNEDQVTVEQNSFDAEFTTLLQSLCISEPMTPEDYVDIQEEQETHRILSDEELLEAAQTVEEDPEQEEAMEKPSFGLTLSEQDCVSGLARAIAILEAYDAMQGEWNVDTEVLISGLRKKQRAIRRKIVEDRESRQYQMSITRFLS
jgi:hypothetical protein